MPNDQDPYSFENFMAQCAARGPEAERQRQQEKVRQRELAEDAFFNEIAEHFRPLPIHARLL